MSNENLSIPFTFMGQTVNGIAGEPVVAALRRAHILNLGQSAIDGTSRGGFCFMGSCQECRVTIDGVIAYACKATVFSGMTVTPYAHS